MSKTQEIEIPETFALLGKAVEVQTERIECKWTSGFFLAADPDGGGLLIGPDTAARRMFEDERPDPEARRVREAFTGRDLDGETWELLDFPEDWLDMGPALSIVYESDKRNGGGTGKPELFEHEFSPGARAYASGRWFAIVGPEIHVNASGVVN